MRRDLQSNMSTPTTDTAPQKIAAKDKALQLGVGKLNRHIFLCIGPSCCAAEMGSPVWDYLKSRLVELGLNQGDGSIYRTKAACLRMCNEGPIALVYPDGTWYRNVTIENLERIVQEHLIAGRVVHDLVIARDVLTTPRFQDQENLNLSEDGGA